NKGDTFHWNVYSDIATQGTTLVETTTMPESNFTIAQGTLTITEFGKRLFAAALGAFCAIVMGPVVAVAA
ncbi:MAG: hypothetical protein ACREXR_22025, partial [Gammaproteobacteria bacterium]